MCTKSIFTLLITTLFIFTSCGGGDGNSDLESSTNPTFDLNKISGSKWSLKRCPESALLTFNGYAECDYFETLEFVGSKVYIKHAGNDIPTLHHICFVNGNELVLSIQACSNTTWKAAFEWNVTTSNESSLIFDAKTPNISIDYQGRFEFKRK